jgi:hypothetical protein
MAAVIISGTTERPFGYFSCPTRPVECSEKQNITVNVILDLGGKKQLCSQCILQAVLTL